MKTKDISISLAQITTKQGNIAYNIEKHCEWIEKAGEYDTDYIVFPELSLTGYELKPSASLIFAMDDERIEVIKNCCFKKKINAIVGAPIRTRAGIIIGSFIILKNGCTMIYSKQYLHEGEDNHFIPGSLNPMISDRNENLSFAICADTSHENHRKNAYENNASVYISSALITPDGYKEDTSVLQKMAEEYKMTVFMANYCGTTGGYQAAGGSCAWNSNGEMIGQLDREKEGLLIIRRDSLQRTWYLDQVIY